MIIVCQSVKLVRLILPEKPCVDDVLYMLPSCWPQTKGQRVCVDFITHCECCLFYKVRKKNQCGSSLSSLFFILLVFVFIAQCVCFLYYVLVGLLSPDSIMRPIVLLPIPGKRDGPLCVLLKVSSLIIKGLFSCQRGGSG